MGGPHKTLEFIFDIVSPNAYLVWQPLRQMLARTGASLAITPVFLGGMHKLTGNAPPFVRDAEVKGKNAYAMLEMNRFIARHALTKFVMNPHFPFNSVTIQRMLTALDGDERIDFIEALLPLVWEQGADVSDPAALGPALEAAGFDPVSLLAQTQDPGIKQALIDATEDAVDRGVFGIPSFFVGEELYFGKERLGQIEEELERK